MPHLRTTVVGSYPVPEWLRAYPTGGALRDAIMVVLKTQELAGIDVVADGELSRFDVNHPETNGMIDYFLRPLGGIRTAIGRKELEDFRRDQGMSYRTAPAGIAEQKLGEGTLNLPRDFALARPLTKAPLKFTLTSPYMLAKVLMPGCYPDRRALAFDLADILAAQVRGIPAEVVQVDEANLPGQPEDGPWAAEAINRVLDAAHGEKGVHLCFGNYGGQSVQRGLWRSLLPFFNALRCDHLVLEFARRGYEELEVFRDLKPGISLGLGVIDIKDNVIESPDAVARRIEDARKRLGAERVRWVHPDCGFWMLPRNVADGKMRALVEGRDHAEGVTASAQRDEIA
jgi:5-methyltetrahydropteroyltriglutamate--homocysteine methyltransferase